MRIGFGENVLTFDPKNIQAVLATQFKDFCVGAEREKCMGPLLGKGIVCFSLAFLFYYQSCCSSSSSSSKN